MGLQPSSALGRAARSVAGAPDFHRVSYVAVAALWTSALGLAACTEPAQDDDAPRGSERQSSQGGNNSMGANEPNVRRYPRPPANSNLVWQRVPPSGRMVDLETGDFVTVQRTDREYEQFILHLRDKN